MNLITNITKTKHRKLPQMTLESFAACQWQCGKSSVCDMTICCESCPAYVCGEYEEQNDTFNVTYRTINYLTKMSQY
jgi:hypothetical protein